MHLLLAGACTGGVGECETKFRFQATLLGSLLSLIDSVYHLELKVSQTLICHIRQDLRNLGCDFLCLSHISWKPLI